MSVILERALSYASDLNFSVFPVHGVNPDGTCTCGNKSCTNIGKHPATRNGLKDASNDSNKITNLFTSTKPYNIGIATGAASNIFVVDIDGMEGETATTALNLPKTLTSLTSRGRHLIFRHPGPKIKNRTHILPSVDIRGDGGYIVAPPSLHKTGVYYQWDAASGYEIANAPDNLMALLSQSPAAPSLPLHAPLRWTDQDVAAMLNVLSPDLPYDEWVSIGMALHDGGYGMSLFNAWSAKGTKYKSIHDIQSHWRSFQPTGGITMGTLVAYAQTQGWQHPENDDLLNIGRAAAESMIQARALKVKSASGATLTLDFANIPGIIGQTVAWILSNSQKPQPELALLNTITALGAVFGRRYASPMDTRTNLYTVGLAGTASGKNHSKKSIKAIMVAANLTEFLGAESIVSGAGMLTDLFKCPAQVMHLDEFGMVLEAIMDKRGATHMKVAGRIITELYSNSGEKYYGGSYADSKKDRTIIACPNLCIFGISTLEKYTSSLNRDAIASGELNRFIVYRAAHDNPTRRRGVTLTPAPDWLVNAWATFKPAQASHGLMDVIPAPVTWPNLQDRIDDMGDFEDSQINANRNGAGALWGRYRENAIKIAMIFAICRNPIKPEIVTADLDIAESLVRQSADFMTTMVQEFMADSQHERDCKDVMQAIKRKGGKIKKMDLCKATQRMDTKQREAAILSLINQEYIIVTEDEGGKGSGRRALWYSSI